MRSGEPRPSCTRRTALRGGTASILASFAAPHLGRAQAEPARFNVGGVEATVLSDGSMNFSLPFILPKTDANVVAHTLNTTPGGAVTGQVNVVVLKSGNRLVLIDAGGSTDFMPSIGKFADRFEAAGFKPDQVTDIVLTHAHPVHFWGVLDGFEEPRYPKARLHLPLAERDFWIKPGLAASLPEFMQGMTIGTQRRLKLLEAQLSGQRTEAEFLPGISYIDTPGHTPGHASVLIASGGASLVVGGDALSNPIVSFEQPDWVWGPDFDAEKAIATRKSLLDRLATDRIPLLGYHLPWPGLGRVERKGLAYRFVAG